MDDLLSELLAKPIGPVHAPREDVPEDFTAKLEVTGNTLSVTLRDKAGVVNEGRALRYIQDEGQDPTKWEVSSWYKVEYGPIDPDTGKPTMESVRFAFKRRPEVEVDYTAIVDDALEYLSGTPAPIIDPGGDCGFIVPIGDMQFGKGLASETPIFTTQGWVRHGDLQVGMSVFGADGKPKKVLAVLPTTERDLYEVEFGDGTTITCDDQHQWSGWRTMHPENYRKGGPNWERREMTLSLPELQAVTEQGSSRPFVILESSAIELPDADLPIDPHLFGLWLGDGNSHTGAITLGIEDRELIEHLGEEIPSNSRDGSMYSVRVAGLTSALRTLGVLGAKRVPDAYLVSSIEQRRALVQGLMDTDGHCGTSGMCEFTNTNKQIIDSMLFLLRSLGMRPRVSSHVGRFNGVDYLPYWRITFRAVGEVFTLPRKSERVRPSVSRDGIRRAVRAVRHVGKGEAQCITVEGSLYLAGREMVVTHNCDGDGVVGTLRRTIQGIDTAADLFYTYSAQFDIEHIHIAWLGDHIEGFTSQGGANVWRTPLPLNEQIRLTRRVMLHALKTFAPLASKVTMAAVPGNHGEPQRFEGSGITRYDDSHDTEALIAVADAAELMPEEFGHVRFFVPDTDELTVMVPVAGTNILHAHGHKWRPGKHWEWWSDQAFNVNSPAHMADVLLAGHLHHDHFEINGSRTYWGQPALESESTWFRHTKGVGGAPAINVGVVRDGRVVVRESIHLDGDV